ncbi:MAG: stage 0 sporulation family protein [Candidatus Omnitrophota bacterium]
MQYEVVLVRIREGDKVAYFSTKDLSAPQAVKPPEAVVEKSPLSDSTDYSYRKKAKIGDCVIIEAERGREYGQVIAEPEMVSESEIEAPLRKVMRVATKEDLAQIEENKKETKDALNICEKKIAEHNLSMKLVSAEYTFDRTKFIFYFIAEGRVDFRELVKDLARHFKARIELRQIGVRDEAKMFGGFGPCGRVLCCKSFLKDFEPVTVRMAKEQNLPLNPSKISGLCGRLMCCLGYEYKVYKELLKDMPKVGETIQIKEGKARVLGTNPLKRTVLVELGEDARQIEIPFPFK